MAHNPLYDVPDVSEYDWSYVSDSLSQAVHQVLVDARPTPGAYPNSEISADTNDELRLAFLEHETIPLCDALLARPEFLDDEVRVLKGIRAYAVNEITAVNLVDYCDDAVSAMCAPDAFVLEYWRRMGDDSTLKQLGVYQPLTRVSAVNRYLDAEQFKLRVTTLLRFIKYPMAGRTIPQIMAELKVNLA